MRLDAGALVTREDPRVTNVGVGRCICALME